MKTYTVMHDKGEWIDGRNVRPYEKFKATPTDELDAKVKKGFLVVEGESSKKKSTKRRK